MAGIGVNAIATSMSLNPTSQKVMKCFKGPTTDQGVARFPTFIIDVTALSGLALAILAIISSELFLADLLGGLLLCFCPYMSYQKRSLLKLETFREGLNELRSNVNEFMRENNVLTHEVNKMSKEVGKLEQVESDLRKIANSDNVDRLVEVVKETKETTEEMKKIVEAQIIQQVITTVIRNDRNHDLSIGPRELDRLMISLDSEPGYDLNKKRFKTLLGNPVGDETVSIEKVMNVIRNLKDPTVSEKDNVFVMRPEQLLKKKY